jgi:uncharacterized membrane protein
LCSGREEKWIIQAIPQNMHRDAAGYFKILFFTFDLRTLLFQMANTLLGQIAIILFAPNFLMKGSVWYLFWPSGAVK